MPTTGGYTEPLKFVMICYIPMVILTLLSGIIAFDIITIIVSPFLFVFAVLGVFISSAIVHIGVLIFASKNMKGFEATMRVVSYTSAVTLITGIISMIPFIGVFISLPFTFYSLYIGVVGTMKVHQTTGFRALLAYILITLVLVIIVAAVVIFAIYSSMVSSAGQPLPPSQGGYGGY
jgi:hypothetical protein